MSGHIVLGQSNYGKSGNHLFKVVRDGARHYVKDIRVDIAVAGDFDAVHTDGDNADVLATDTMRNTVYAQAKEHSFDSTEEFGLIIVEHLLTQPRINSVRVNLVEQHWDRIQVDGQGHDHSFTKSAGGKHVAEVTGEGEHRQVRSGVHDLWVLKTTDAGWSGFLEGGYRTLSDTDDRIVATSVTANWVYEITKGDFEQLWSGVLERITSTFTDHYSPSVQNTLWRMGRTVLEQFPEIGEIRLSLPNKHHIKYDLSPFGLDNNNEIFFVSVEPYGLIEATIRRD
jgi:urate oxidase